MMALCFLPSGLDKGAGAFNQVAAGIHRSGNALLLHEENAGRAVLLLNGFLLIHGDQPPVQFLRFLVQTGLVFFQLLGLILQLTHVVPDQLQLVLQFLFRPLQGFLSQDYLALGGSQGRLRLGKLALHSVEDALQGHLQAAGFNQILTDLHQYGTSLLQGHFGEIGHAHIRTAQAAQKVIRKLSQYSGPLGIASLNPAFCLGGAGLGGGHGGLNLLLPCGVGRLIVLKLLRIVAHGCVIFFHGLVIFLGLGGIVQHGLVIGGSGRLIGVLCQGDGGFRGGGLLRLCRFLRFPTEGGIDISNHAINDGKGQLIFRITATGTGNSLLQTGLDGFKRSLELIELLLLLLQLCLALL